MWSSKTIAKYTTVVETLNNIKRYVHCLDNIHVSRIFIVMYKNTSILCNVCFAFYRILSTLNACCWCCSCFSLFVTSYHVRSSNRVVSGLKTSLKDIHMPQATVKCPYTPTQDAEDLPPPLPSIKKILISIRLNYGENLTGDNSNFFTTSIHFNIYAVCFAAIHRSRGG